MSEIIIKVENLGKKYIIGHQSQSNGYLSFRDTLMQNVSGLWNKTKDLVKGNPIIQGDLKEEMWALKDVSFEITQGQSVGIIGRNGAGKSTLLKILSRITEPTTGRAIIKGRIASLLEVGTGFHPELTGRENIFLNGTILGMNRSEIKIKFDEIVAFAEIEKYLDTPVKRYSSGMYVRLAFAVAAHLETEILIIDEVLAVGDTIFQKKCIDKMTEARGQGKTVLFVSHNFSAIKALCNRSMLLNNGELVFCGNVEETIATYMDEHHLEGQEIDLRHVERHRGQQDLIFDKITFLNYPIRFGERICLKIKLVSTGTKRKFAALDFGIAIQDKNLNTIIHCSNRYLDLHFEYTSDRNEYLFEIDNILKPDVYYLVLFLRSNEVIQDWITGVVRFEIQDGNPYGFHDTRQMQGVILPGFRIQLLSKTA